MIHTLRSFHSEVTDSRRGLIVPEELYRSIVTALGSGGLVGFCLTIVQAILTHVVSIFPDPAIASLATITLTLILDLLRRQNQGPGPSAVPPPITVPVSVAVEAQVALTEVHETVDH